MKSIKEIRERVKHFPNIKKVAVAAAEDEEVLLAVKCAGEEGFAEPLLIGNEEKIREIARSIGYDLSGIALFHETDPFQAARKAVALVKKGDANVVMKGMLGTAPFLKAVLEKETGLRSDGILSHVTVFETSYLDRLLLVSDCAMNIAPDLSAKTAILNNLLPVAKALEIRDPKAAVICAVETVNQEMPATADAAVLAMMCRRGQIKGMLVDGPLALDNAISLESAMHKGIKSEAAGKADILLMPDIEAGNVLYKALVYLAGAKNAGIIMGAAAPVVLTSRSDSAEAKLNSIALGILVSESMSRNG